LQQLNTPQSDTNGNADTADLADLRRSNPRHPPDKDAINRVSTTQKPDLPENIRSNAEKALLKSRFCGSGGGLSEKLFETRRRRVEFFSRRRSFRKIVGFQYSLDFFGYFLHQGKK
jgi:hypothetical protein